MANQQQIIYNNYVATFANVVQPTVLPKGTWPEKLEGEIWTKECGRYCRTAKWAEREYGSTAVYSTSTGRVIEFQSLHRGLSFIVAVFENEKDWLNFRRPMGMFHYFHG